jgi:hypothetical protein
VGSILITFSGEHPELFDEARAFAQRLQGVHAGSITSYEPDIDFNAFARDIGALANEGMEMLQRLAPIIALETEDDLKDFLRLSEMFNEIDSRASIMEQEDFD